MEIGFYSTQIGIVQVQTQDEKIVSLSFVKKPGKSSDSKFMKKALKELDLYFTKQKATFDIPFDITGTEFQKKVLKKMSEIPFGKSVSYSELAQKSGYPKAVRAVGMVCRNNNIPIVIPCHRVLGKSGKLTGFNAGIWRKEWLLKHESILPT